MNRTEPRPHHRRDTTPMGLCAHQIAARGWPIFPCVPGRKEPLTKNGCKDATTDLARIDTWWTKWPGANIGLATGRPEKCILVVDLDVDETKGLNGFSTWAAVVAQHSPGMHPGLNTLAVATPRGGRHLYLRVTNPTTGACRNSGSTLGKGIDTRGTGGYVILPPSHTNSGVYTRALAAPIQPAPTWLLSLLEPAHRRTSPQTAVFVPPANTTAYALAAITGETERIRNAPSGTRNHTIFTASIALGQLVGGGALSENDAVAALLDATQTHIGIDGFTQNEAETAIRSGLARGIAEPRTITPRKAG